MKPLTNIRKVLISGLVLILCAGAVGAAQAAPQATLQD